MTGEPHDMKTRPTRTDTNRQIHPYTPTRAGTEHPWPKCKGGGLRPPSFPVSFCEGGGRFDRHKSTICHQGLKHKTFEENIGFLALPPRLFGPGSRLERRHRLRAPTPAPTLSQTTTTRRRCRDLTFQVRPQFSGVVCNDVGPIDPPRVPYRWISIGGSVFKPTPEVGDHPGDPPGVIAISSEIVLCGVLNSMLRRVLPCKVRARHGP